MALLLYDRNGKPKNEAAAKQCKAWGVETLQELKARRSRVYAAIAAKKENRSLEPRNCGTGAGGFKLDNTCAKGGDGEPSSDKPSQPEKRPEGGYTDKIRGAIDKEMAARGLDPEKSYTRARGLLDLPAAEVVQSIAAEQQAQNGKPLSKEAKASYDAFKSELLDQYNALVEAGLRPIPFEGKGEPYNAGPDKLWTPSSEVMRKEVERTGDFYFFKTQTGFGEEGSKPTEGHPLLEVSPAKDANGSPLLWNDVFRVVHDNVAHIRGGFGFNTKGEMNGMIAHASTLTPAARPALFAETFAQNSVFETTKKFAAQNAFAPSPASMAVLDDLLAKAGKLTGTNQRAMPDEDHDDEDMPTGPGRLRRQPHGDDASEGTELEPDDESKESRNCGETRESRNCGTGAGGFQPGNTCAKGGDGELLSRAIVSWKGNPSDMVLHMKDAIAGKPAPQSASGKKKRDMAEALLRALDEMSEPAPTLYRGDNRHPASIDNPAIGWTDNPKVAHEWAAQYGGEVYTLTGAVGLPIDKIAGDSAGYGFEGEWIVKKSSVANGYIDGGESRNCGTGAGGFQPGNTCAKGGDSADPGSPVDARGEPAKRVTELLLAGHNVTVRAKDIDKIFRKMATRDENPDITNLVIHGTTLFGGEGLGIARGDMPQLGDNIEGFREQLRAAGISSEDVQISPMPIKPVQKEISGRKAGIKYLKITKKGRDAIKPVIVSRDGFVIDGHHGWAASVARATKSAGYKMNAIVLDADHQTALRHAHEWMASQGVQPKTLDTRERRNCGTGAGGFKENNTCAKGGDGGGVPNTLAGKPFDKVTKDEIYDAFRPKDGATDDEILAAGNARRDYFKAWNSANLAAVSEGRMTVDAAKALGVSDAATADIQPLPPVMYHVTIAGDAIEKDGLKTPYQRGSRGGEGLGGGFENAVCVTTSERVANGIYDGMRELKDVLDGKITPQDIIEEAKSGKGANRPWHAELMSCLDSYYGKGQSEGVLKGVRIESSTEAEKFGGKSGGLVISKEDAPPDWRPVGEPLVGGDGVERWARWERPATTQEKREALFQLYRANSLCRETAGGRYDPFFAFNDLDAFQKMPVDQIRMFKLSPATPDAKGEKIDGAEAEYRVYSGKAIKIDEVVK